LLVSIVATISSQCPLQTLVLCTEYIIKS